MFAFKCKTFEGIFLSKTFGSKYSTEITRITLCHYVGCTKLIEASNNNIFNHKIPQSYLQFYELIVRRVCYNLYATFRTKILTDLNSLFRFKIGDCCLMLLLILAKIWIIEVLKIFSSVLRLLCTIGLLRLWIIQWFVRKCKMNLLLLVFILAHINYKSYLTTHIGLIQSYIMSNYHHWYFYWHTIRKFSF